MQYDLDIASPQAELFLHLRSVILSFPQIKEKRNAKQTSYYDAYGALCFLRVRQGKVRLSFANGATLYKEFSNLLGSAKIVRYLEFGTLRDVDDLLIKKLIDESLLLNMEKDALRDLRKTFKQQ